jgi:hypothetical protein
MANDDNLCGAGRHLNLAALLPYNAVGGIDRRDDAGEDIVS